MRKVSRIGWMTVAAFFFALAVGCSGGGAGVVNTPDDTSQPRITLDYPPGRILIDVYQIIVHPKEGKVEAVKARGVASHWDVTDWVLNDPDPYCPQCSELWFSGIDAKNSFYITLLLRNNSLYVPRDVRAILVENSTNPDTLEVLFPDGYTDIFAQTHNDQDPGTNPFIAYKKGEPDRHFTNQGLEKEETKMWRVIYNQGYTGGPLIALLIIDASWHPDEDAKANCKEPYSIDIIAGQYINLLQGENFHTIHFHARDHQENYDDLEATVTFSWGEIQCNVQKGDFGLFICNIYIVSPSFRGGTYEGIIEVTDTSIPPWAPVRSLKEKIWLTWNPYPPLIEDASSGVEMARFVSSPVRVDIDNDSFLETVYTADRRLWIIDEEGIHCTPPICNGCFIGVPTFSKQDTGNAKDIIIANDPMGVGGIPPFLYVYRYTQGSGFQSLWSYELPSAPAGQPIPVLFSEEPAYDRILVLCKGGQKVLLRGGPNPSPQRLVYNINSGDSYIGAPAIYENDPVVPMAAFIKTDQYGIDKLEIFRIRDSSVYAQATLAPIPESARPTPVIDLGDYGSGDNKQIFVSCFDGVGRIQDEGDGFLSLGWIHEISGHHNEYSQMALGDMNHDMIPDIVVAYDTLMVALRGQDGAEIWSYEIPDKDYYFHSPSLIDFNNDNNLDVVTGIFPLSENMPKLIVLDGSPFNDHKRLNINDRILWEYNPYGQWTVMYQQPCLTKFPDGTLRINMTFMEHGFGTYGGFLYLSICTGYWFGWDGQPFQRKPWLAPFYNNRAENYYYSEWPDYFE